MNMKLNKIKIVYWLKNNYLFFLLGFLIVISSIPNIINEFFKYQSLSFNISDLYFKGPAFIIFSIVTFLSIARQKLLNSKLFLFLLTIFVVFSVYSLVMPNHIITKSPSYADRPDLFIITEIDINVTLLNLFNILTLCIFASFFLIALPNSKVKKRNILHFTYFIFAYSLFSIIYAFVVQGKEYIVFLSSPSGTGLSKFTSFFGNKNSFGSVMLISFLLSMYWYNETKNFKFLFISFIYMVFSFMTFSKTSAFISVIIMSIVYINFCRRIIISRHRSFDLLIIIVPIVLLTSLLFLMYIEPFSNFSVFKFLANIFNKFLGFDGSISSNGLFTGREDFWYFSFKLFLSPQHFLLGYTPAAIDNIVFESAINIYGTKSLMSTYGTVFISYGLIGIIVFLLLICYIFKIILLKKKKEKTLINTLVFMSYLVYSFFESMVIFDSAIICMIWSFTCILPILKVNEINRYLDINYKRVHI